MKKKKKMAEECKKKIEQILSNYNIENTATNFNSITNFFH